MSNVLLAQGRAILYFASFVWALLVRKKDPETHALLLPWLIATHFLCNSPWWLEVAAKLMT